MTQREIMDTIGICNSTTSRWLHHLHKKPSAVYISGWTREGVRGNYSAVWSAGYFMEDAPKPGPMTSSEYNARWRMKNKLRKAIDRSEPGVIKHVNS
jgi:hypothetical protein